MGILLICPHCRDRISLACQTCPGCGMDLRRLPPESRCYFFEEMAGEAAAPISPPAKSEMEDELPPLAVAQAPLENDVSLCEALDRILHKGAVVFGEVMISVADIDLVYLGLQVILASMETARGWQPAPGWGQVEGPRGMAGGGPG